MKNHGLEFAQFLPGIDYRDIEKRASERIAIREQIAKLEDRYVEVYFKILADLEERYSEAEIQEAEERYKQEDEDEGDDDDEGLEACFICGDTEGEVDLHETNIGPVCSSCIEGGRPSWEYEDFKVLDKSSWYYKD